MIDIEQGPVFSTHHFVTTNGSYMLYLAAHHLVVDLQSCFVVVNDLESVLANNPPRRSGPSVTYRKYIQDQQLHVLGPA